MSIREDVKRSIDRAVYYGDARADAAITAFLKAAAEQGWHMRPDEATEGMQRVIAGRCQYPARTYRAMLAAAPPFEWDK